MNLDSHLIQRKRLGEISFIDPKGSFGFIKGEDFRDDVFFHMSVWQAEEASTAPAVSMVVEYEIDLDHRIKTDKLRAMVVRPSNRPYTSVLDVNRDPRLKAKRHPKARKRKPSWRRDD